MMPGPMGMNPAMPPNKMMIPPLMTGMDDARKGQEAERRRYEERNRERRDRERPADAVAGAERKFIFAYFIDSIFKILYFNRI